MNNIVQIWEDRHTEQNGYFRAFWCVDVDSTSGSPVIGYCSPGGSHRTVKRVAQEVRRMYSDVLIYRNGRLVKTCR